jgi:hypothetical protein
MDMAVKAMMICTPIRKGAMYKASPETMKIIVSQAIKQGAVVKIRMVLRPTTFQIYERRMIRNTEPTDSITTIQDSSSADMEIGESAASSIRMVGVTQATPRPASLNSTEAEEKKDT